jgi:hypothetical protein
MQHERSGDEKADWTHESPPDEDDEPGVALKSALNTPPKPLKDKPKVREKRAQKKQGLVELLRKPGLLHDTVCGMSRFDFCVNREAFFVMGLYQMSWSPLPRRTK